jgi:pimeloyl-ACP methyl ester carboxylesterase
MDDIVKLSPLTLPLHVGGVDVQISGVHRPGAGTPLVFLHGFGSTKEDYLDIVHQRDLVHHPVLAYDAPGCGRTQCSDLDTITIPFLVKVAEEVLAHHGIDRFIIIGHSMGGLTALTLANQHPDRVVGFVNIEGNISPEDCFLSRQIIDHTHHDPEGFMMDFVARLEASRFYSSGLYAASLPHKVRAQAVRPIFESMVSMSDNEPLMDWFLTLPAPRMLMYGEQNTTLTYLPTLEKTPGVELAEIARSGHFPMYSNAPQMWDRIRDFVIRTEPTTDEVRHPW